MPHLKKLMAVADAARTPSAGRLSPVVRRIMGLRPTLTIRSKKAIYLWTVLGTLGCIFAALYLDSFNFVQLNAVERHRAIVFDTLVPLVLALPLFYMFTSKLFELELARQQLLVVASTDSLTACFNRGAFTTLVDAYLKEAAAHLAPKNGALLVVDADNFKTINDCFGHDRGDQALILIADTIKKTLRSPDLIGRIGGEEFGIFLPGASARIAHTVAEQIRISIADADFRPDGAARPLSVSVGGAAFDTEVPFGDLFRIADQRLYSAKQHGRNRVEVASMPLARQEATLH